MSALLSVAPVTAPSNVPSGDLTVADRIIEIVAVILLGLSTVGTAWCAYQAAQWSAASSELARESSDQQVESARLFGLATQKVAYDSTIVAQYAEAAAIGNMRLVRFYRSSLVRPEFVPILDRWEADIRAGQAPTPLTDDPDYVAAQLADYQKSGQPQTSSPAKAKRQATTPAPTSP